MKKYEILEQKVKELNAEIERLKKIELGTAPPSDFSLDSAIKILNGDLPKSSLFFCFSWEYSPQGREFWRRIKNADENVPMPDEAIIQLQKWVIHSLLDEQNNKTD